MRRGLLTTLLLVFACSTTSAQVQDRGEVRAEVSFAMGIPQGTFDARLEREAFGLLVFAGGRVPRSPLVLGSEIGFMNYGTGSRLRIHRTVFDDGIDPDLALPLEALNVAVTNTMWMGHLVVRLQPATGVIQPYLDGIAGLRYFVTRIGVESDVVVFRRGLSQDSRITDLAFSYGAGGGFEVLLYEQTSDWNDRTATVSLHGGLRYLFTTEAEYAGRASFTEIDDQIVVGLGRSRTEMFVPTFGIRVRH